MGGYIISFLAVLVVVSAVSAIIENRPARETVREAVKLFVGPLAGMAILALVVFFLSR